MREGGFIKVNPDEIIATEPSEWRVLQAMRGWERTLAKPVIILEDDLELAASFFLHAARTIGELE